MRSVVITGTSTGIGWGTAKVLIGRGFRVFGSVRKTADAERLASEFGENFVPLLFDVTDEAAVKAAAAEVRTALGGERLAGLVNNAGIAVAGPLLELPIEDFRHQIEVNLIGVVIVTKAFAPLLGTDPQLKGAPGRIVNISSVGGRVATPFVGALQCLQVRPRRLVGKLAAGAFAVRHRRHRHRTGRGGNADLEQGRAGRRRRPISTRPMPTALDRLRTYMLTLGKTGLPPERLGEAVLHALTAAQPKVRYAVSPQPVQDFLARSLPKRVVDRLVGGRLGLLPRK